MMLSCFSAIAEADSSRERPHDAHTASGRAIPEDYAGPANTEERGSLVSRPRQKSTNWERDAGKTMNALLAEIRQNWAWLKPCFRDMVNCSRIRQELNR
jgi:hypothetical protein